jgi:hypothetical protein
MADSYEGLFNSPCNMAMGLSDCLFKSSPEPGRDYFDESIHLTGPLWEHPCWLPDTPCVSRCCCPPQGPKEQTCLLLVPTFGLVTAVLGAPDCVVICSSSCFGTLANTQICNTCDGIGLEITMARLRHLPVPQRSPGDHQFSTMPSQSEQSEGSFAADAMPCELRRNLARAVRPLQREVEVTVRGWTHSHSTKPLHAEFGQHGSTSLSLLEEPHLWARRERRGCTTPGRPTNTDRPLALRAIRAWRRSRPGRLRLDDTRLSTSPDEVLRRGTTSLHR